MSRESAERILSQAQAIVEERNRRGWTREDWSAGLAQMLDVTVDSHSFVGYEYRDGEATGREFVYVAPTLAIAVENCLYTERLANGEAFVGPTGLVVHSGTRCVVFPKA